MIALDHQTPWMVGIELSEHAYEHAGYSGEQGVEEQLVAPRAGGRQGHRRALKRIAENSSADSPSCRREDQVRMLEQSLDDLKDLPREMKDIVAAWRRGDAQRLATLLSSEYDAFPALYRPLVTVRNEHWLPQIEAAAQGQRQRAWWWSARCTWWARAACSSCCAGRLHRHAAELTPRARPAARPRAR